MPGDYSTPLLLFASTIVTGFLSAVIPVINAEAFVLFLGTVVSRPLLPAALLVATASHMAGKALLYGVATRVDSLPEGRIKRRIVVARAKVSGHTGVGGTLLFVSSLVGVPPFYLITVLCGIVRFRFVWFLVIGFAGRLIRFGVLMLVPHGIGAVLE